MPTPAERDVILYGAGPSGSRRLSADEARGWIPEKAGSRTEAVAIVRRAMASGDLRQPLVTGLGQLLSLDRSLEPFVRTVYATLGGGLVVDPADGRLSLHLPA